MKAGQHVMWQPDEILGVLMRRVPRADGFEVWVVLVEDSEQIIPRVAMDEMLSSVVLVIDQEPL